MKKINQLPDIRLLMGAPVSPWSRAVKRELVWERTRAIRKP